MTLRIGWIGCGVHANEMLLPAIDAARRRARCAVRHGQRAPRSHRPALRHRRRRPHGGLAPLLQARDDIDAVGVAAGPAAHHQIELAALARGLLVFLEKPPAATVAQAEELAAASRASGKPVVLGFMKRYSTSNRIAYNVTRRAEFDPTRVSWANTSLRRRISQIRLPRLLSASLRALLFRSRAVADHKVEHSVRAHELAPGKLIHLDFRFASGGIGTLVVGTHQSRGTPMESSPWDGRPSASRCATCTKMALFPRTALQGVGHRHDS